MSLSKKHLIKNLENDVYTRIKPSKYGVGVFAIKDIPKGKNPFLITGNKNSNPRILNINQDELINVDKEVQKMIVDFYFKDNKNNFGIPINGLNSNDITFYLNSSTTPNLKIVDDGTSLLTFRTVRPIKKGEELFINYEEY